MVDAAPTPGELDLPETRSGSALRKLISAPEFGPLVLLVLEIAVFTAFSPEFLSVLNISNTLTFTVELGLIALAMTLLMTAGEFDLSVGSLFGFAPVMMWTLYNAGVTSLGVAFVMAGTLAVVGSAIQHSRFVATLPQIDLPPSYSKAFALVLSTCVAVLGAALSGYLLITQA